jgi:AcrR family transcriptional regulator
MSRFPIFSLTIPISTVATYYTDLYRIVNTSLKGTWMSRTLSSDVRRQILDAAGASFYQNGFQAIGVDALAERAGVSKMTLYRHFPSKDDLIVSVLNEFDQGTQRFYGQIMAKAKTPRAKLLAIFTWIAERASESDCRGCAFQNGAAEFPDVDHVVHQAAFANKLATHAAYLEQAKAMGARDPKTLADQLLLLTDGAWAAARMWGAKSPARSVVAAAKTLIDAQIE